MAQGSVGSLGTDGCLDGNLLVADILYNMAMVHRAAKRRDLEAQHFERAAAIYTAVHRTDYVDADAADAYRQMQRARDCLADIERDEAPALPRACVVSSF